MKIILMILPISYLFLLLKQVFVYMWISSKLSKVRVFLDRDYVLFSFMSWALVGFQSECSVNTYWKSMNEWMNDLLGQS